jgi:hypothetical protein
MFFILAADSPAAYCSVRIVLPFAVLGWILFALGSFLSGYSGLSVLLLLSKDLAFASCGGCEGRFVYAAACSFSLRSIRASIERIMMRVHRPSL